MNKKKLARVIGVCTIAIMLIVVITIFPSCESSPTVPTYGLEFDGIDDRVDVANNASLNFVNAITIECWAKRVGSGSGDFVYLVNKGLNDQWIIFQDQAGTALSFNVNVGGNLSSHYANFNFADGEWHHIAAVYDGPNKEIWIDGVNYLSVEALGQIGTTDKTLNIGGRTTDNSRNFKGTISELRIWNYARTESQIKAAISEELTGTEEGLIGYWKLNEGSGTIAHDSTANNNHGTLVGNPVWFTGGD